MLSQKGLMKKNKTWNVERERQKIDKPRVFL